MKKITLLFATLFLLIGMAQAQTVYYSGNSNGIGKVWKNDSLVHNVSDTVFSVNLQAFQVVNDSNIYCAGYVVDSTFSFAQGRIWLNDSIIFSAGTNTAINNFVLHGSQWTATGFGENQWETVDGLVWQDGALLYAFSDSTLTNQIKALVIDTVTGDIYTAGTSAELESRATVWKNDTILWIEDSISDIYALAFNGIDLFAAGSLYTQEQYWAALWQNDSIVFTIASEDAEFDAIALRDNSIYLAGYNGDTLFIWQDSAVLYSHPFSSESKINVLVVNEFGVYYAGLFNGVATVWKDGEVLYQPDDCEAIQGLCVLPSSSQPIIYTLTVEADTTGWGTVVGGGTFYYGDTAIIEALPNIGCEFLYWNDSITENPLSIVITQDSSFTAHFGLIDYTITTSVDPEEGGTITGGGIYHYGDTLVLEAVPNAGFVFEMWSDSITDNPREIIVTQDSSFTAHFGLIDYTITTSVDPEEGGTVTEGGIYHYGDTLVLEATPNAGYVFEMWNDSITDNPREIIVTQDCNFIAQFSLIDYNITTSVAPNNAGTVTEGGIYHYGDTLVLEATPNAGYVFEMWSDSITDNPREIIVTQDCNFIAQFSLIDYNITTSVTPNNAGTVTEGGIYHYGDTFVLEATPNAGYVFEMWNDDITDNPREIIVTQDNDFIAYFSVLQCLIEAYVLPEASGIVTGGGVYPYGTTIQLKAIPNLGYEFLTWSDGNTDNPRTVVVTESQTLTATFGLRQCVISADVTPEESGIVIGSGTYSYGDTILLVAQNSDGYAFKMWDDEVFNNPRQVIVNGDATYTAIFTPLQYIITTNWEPLEGGRVEGEGTYLFGETATLEAIPSANYAFVCWNDGIVSNPRTITVKQNATYTALFQYTGIPEYFVKAIANHDEWGIVEGSGRYPEGSVIEISATPTDSTKFVSWDDGNTDNPRSVTVNSDMVFTAIFELLPRYTITVNSYSNEMGTVYGGGTYYVNSVIEIGAVANTGFYFTGWQDNNMNNPRSITVTEDAEFTAYFSRTPIPTFTVTVFYDENQGFILGLGTNSNTGTFSAGTTISLAAIPADGYYFVKWSDGTEDNPKEILVDHDIELAAFFNGTGVDENGFGNVSLYPNPANDKLRIEGLEGEHEIQIYNAFGALVKVLNIDGDSEVNVGDLTAGYYFLRVGSHAMKFVKE